MSYKYILSICQLLVIHVTFVLVCYTLNLTIYHVDCTQNRWGPGCENSCNCMGPCDGVTGNCAVSCMPGKMGTICQEGESDYIKLSDSLKLAVNRMFWFVYIFPFIAIYLIPFLPQQTARVATGGWIVPTNATVWDRVILSLVNVSRVFASRARQELLVKKVSSAICLVNNMQCLNWILYTLVWTLNLLCVTYFSFEWYDFIMIIHRLPGQPLGSRLWQPL